MNIFILGAGYVGRFFLSSAKSSSDHFIASTTSVDNVSTLKPLADEVHVLKSSQRKELKKILDRADAMAILIAASGSQSYEEVYLETAKAVSFALRERILPFYLLYTSSAFVYQGQKEHDVTEERQLAPTHPRAQILLEAESIYLSSANEQVKVCILRLGGIYGPGRDLLARARSFSNKELAGSGDEPTNHIHVEDIVLAMQFCMKKRLEGVYNLVNDAHPTRKKLYSKLCQQLGIPPPSWNREKASEHGSGCIVSNQKVKDRGFTFYHPGIEEKNA